MSFPFLTFSTLILRQSKPRDTDKQNYCSLFAERNSNFFIQRSNSSIMQCQLAFPEFPAWNAAAGSASQTPCPPPCLQAATCGVSQGTYLPLGCPFSWLNGRLLAVLQGY